MTRMWRFLLTTLLLVMAVPVSADRWPSTGGGGGAGVAPGLTGSLASDTTLEYLANLKHAEFMPSLPQVYFSSGTTDVVAGCSAILGPARLGGYPTGDDATGDGSRSRPYRSLGRVMAVTRAGGVIAVLDACDSWADASDAESAGFLLAAAGGVKFMSWASTTNLKCTGHPDELCFAMIGSDPSGTYRPLIDFDNLTGATPNGSFFTTNLIATQGWMHFENLRIGKATFPYPNDGADGCTAAPGPDLFRTDVNGRLSIVNIEAYLCNISTGANEFWTSHSSPVVNSDTNYTWSLNNQVYYPDLVGVDQAAPIYLNIGSSSLGIIGGFGEVTAQSAADGAGPEMCLGMTGTGGNNYGFVHLWDCYFLDDGVTEPDGIICGTGNDDTVECYIFASRTRISGLRNGAGNNDGAFWNVMSGATPPHKNVTHVGYRNSSIDNFAFAHTSANLSANDEILVVDYCSVHWKGPTAGNDNAIFYQGATDCTGLNLKLFDTGVIENDTVVARFENNNYATSALALAGSAARGCNYGPAGFPAAQWQPTVLTSNPFGTEGLSGIVSTAEASAACTVGPITEMFRNGFYIPSYLTGIKVIGAIQNAAGLPVPLGR